MALPIVKLSIVRKWSRTKGALGYFTVYSGTDYAGSVCHNVFMGTALDDVEASKESWNAFRKEVDVTPIEWIN